MVSQYKKLYCEEQWQRQGVGLGSRCAQGRAGRAGSRLGAGHAGAGPIGRAHGASVLGVQGALRACLGLAGGARGRAARHGRAKRWRAR